MAEPALPLPDAISRGALAAQEAASEPHSCHHHEWNVRVAVGEGREAQAALLLRPHPGLRRPPVGETGQEHLFAGILR